MKTTELPSQNGHAVTYLIIRVPIEYNEVVSDGISKPLNDQFRGIRIWLYLHENL
jgi:hypothetical protein